MKLNEVIPFKGRKLNVENPIHVYRNLNRKGKVYSIRQKGVVVGHTTAICMRQCTFVVNDSGKAKAVRTMVRNVHAYINGHISDNWQMVGKEQNVKVNYRPFNNLAFYHTIGQKDFNIESAVFCTIDETGVHASFIKENNVSIR
jgi:hypothetical protein